MKNSQPKSSQSEKDNSLPVNQKKLNNSNSKSRSVKSPKESPSKGSKKHKLFKQSLYLKSPYMKTFIKKHSKDAFKCLKCHGDTVKKTGKEFMWCENLYSHITSEIHKENTPSNEEGKLKELIELIKNNKKSKKSVLSDADDIDEEDNDPETVNYLKFIAFCVSLRLSYSQVSQIGCFLQSFAKENQLEFLLSHYFDEEVISKIVSECFLPVLKEKIHNDLINSKYSLSLDTATMTGLSLCVIKAKYLRRKRNPIRRIKK